MRTLLTFIGSVIGFIITIIISPLLAVVYAGIGLSRLSQSIHWQRPALSTLRGKLPSVHIPAKRQWNLLWQKALRLH